jgi:hypothetical protein
VELQLKIFSNLDQCSSACLGLTCKRFWSIHSHTYPITSLICFTTVPDKRQLGGKKAICLVHVLEEWFRFRGLLGPWLWEIHFIALRIENALEEVAARGQSQV